MTSQTDKGESEGILSNFPEWTELTAHRPQKGQFCPASPLLHSQLPIPISLGMYIELVCPFQSLTQLSKTKRKLIQQEQVNSQFGKLTWLIDRVT